MSSLIKPIYRPLEWLSKATRFLQRSFFTKQQEKWIDLKSLYLFKLESFILLMFLGLLHLNVENESKTVEAENRQQKISNVWSIKLSKVWWLSPTIDYSDHVATFQVTLSGETLTNPGPI